MIPALRRSITDRMVAADRDALLARCRPTRHAPGDVLFTEGAAAQTLHLVVSGRVLVDVTTPHGDRATIAVLGPGETFGEVALAQAFAPDAPDTSTAPVDADRPDGIPVPVTQEVLATLAGTSRVTTNQVLQRLQAQGTVVLRRARITVPDLGRLRAAADAGIRSPADDALPGRLARSAGIPSRT